MDTRRVLLLGGARCGKSAAAEARATAVAGGAVLAGVGVYTLSTVRQVARRR